MRWRLSVSLLAITCLAGAVAFAPLDSAQETHCATEPVAGGGAAGPVTCFETEAELNQAAGLKNPAESD